MRPDSRHRAGPGYSMIELMIVVSIIGIMAALFIPAVQKSRLRSQATRLAKEMRMFGETFALHAMQRGAYPVESENGALPDSILTANALRTNLWYRGTPFGGLYDWESPSEHGYVGIAMLNVSLTMADLVFVDGLIDDGNLSAGQFQRMANGRYTMLIETGTH